MIINEAIEREIRLSASILVATPESTIEGRARDYARTIARTIAQPLTTEIEILRADFDAARAQLEAFADFRDRPGDMRREAIMASKIAQLETIQGRHLADFQRERDALLAQLARETNRADQAIAERDELRKVVRRA